jgi:DNA-binding MarR family transcriptional regulator
LIVRRLDPADGRKTLIEITEKGGLLLMDEVYEQQAQLAGAITESLSVSENEALRSAADLIDRLAGELDARLKKEKNPAKAVQKKR